jgi:hypothetical protein
MLVVKLMFGIWRFSTLIGVAMSHIISDSTDDALTEWGTMACVCQHFFPQTGTLLLWT